MPGKSISIDKYRLIHCFHGGAGGILAYIWCNPDSSAGIISFYPKGQVPASNVVIKILGGKLFDLVFFYLNCEIDRYQEIIETIRYEKPVYAHVYWDANNVR
jgi:hypothetical protein